VSAALCLAALTACHVEGSVKGSVDAKDSTPETTTAPAASAPAPAAPAAPSAPPPPRADACPLTCFEPQGSLRVALSAEEQTQLQSALEPVLGRMRSCTSDGDWRHRGSPVIHLRIAPDGTLNELDVDPHHGLASSCFEESARDASPTVALPGRKVIRCVERCGHEPARSGGHRGRGRGR
jgi:hypothetical protein